MRRFASAHTQGITSAKFSKDGLKVLTGSYDATVRIHGLKSGKTLQILRGRFDLSLFG